MALQCARQRQIAQALTGCCGDRVVDRFVASPAALG
jgi:hypothetical protein